MKKHTKKIIQISILIAIVTFWVLVFFMRDTNPNWCNLSLGTYDVQGSKTVRDSYGFLNSRDIYGCTGGIFGFLDQEAN